MKRSGATWAGFHFLESFKTCKRKWMLRYVYGLESDRKPFQLVFGGCFHEGKAEFYRTGSSSKALKVYRSSLKDSKVEIEDSPRYYPLLLERGPTMLERWIQRLGKNDIRIYDILAVEKLLTVDLPNGYRFTVRIDVAGKGPGGVYLFDTKTSWYSANLQAEQLETSDQTTAYLYAWNLKHPKTPAQGLVPDCIYWNVNSPDPDKIECVRSVLVTRSARELKEWEEGVMSDLKDMASRVLAMKRHGEASTFPRTTSYCLSYNRKCEYLDICRHRVKGLPPGFHDSPWKGREKLLGGRR